MVDDCYEYMNSLIRLQEFSPCYDWFSRLGRLIHHVRDTWSASLLMVRISAVRKYPHEDHILFFYRIFGMNHVNWASL